MEVFAQKPNTITPQKYKMSQSIMASKDLGLSPDFFHFKPFDKPCVECSHGLSLTIRVFNKIGYTTLSNAINQNCIDRRYTRTHSPLLPRNHLREIISLILFHSTLKRVKKETAETIRFDT